MQTNRKESIIMSSIREKEHEKYSFYKKHELTHIILSLMDAFETEKYKSNGKLEYGNIEIEAEEATEYTKQFEVDTSLINYADLQLEYDLDDAVLLFGFGPSESRFKLNLPKEQDLDYIQDFADVLYAYRSEHELKELPHDELDNLLKVYLELSQEEIEVRKRTKFNQKVKKITSKN